MNVGDCCGEKQEQEKEARQANTARSEVRRVKQTREDGVGNRSIPFGGGG
ncbi:hypothetical protein PspLS_01496 [Pyricularia sp. CBS 133598]|nr:hypothetical protein PspLS_01496 [Pyricularia sp. CBS 133598]